MKNLPILLLLILPTLVAVSSCATVPKPKPFTIKAALHPSLAGTSLQVDLVGANKFDLPKWVSYSMTEYWQPNNVARRDASKETFEFGRGHPEVQSFTSTNPLWREWLASGSLYVVVMADLPGSWTDQPGEADPRRSILPLDQAEWVKGTETIELVIQQGGIRVLTARSGSAKR